ncbi:hypothetical protein LCGC14_2913370, partial [marine sediment metagenome]
NNISLTGGGGDVSFIIGNSFESGTGRGTIKSEQPSEVQNFVQIMQHPIGVTTTAKHLGYTSDPEMDKQRFETGVDHAFAIEKTLFWGQRAQKNVGLFLGKFEQWWTGGVHDFISTNAVDAGGALTQSEFSSFLIQSTKYAKAPVVFASERLYEGLTQWAETKLELVRNETTLGMAVAKYMTPYGDIIKVMPHRELLIDALNKYGFCLDISELEYRFLAGLDTHVERDIQTPGDKQHIDEFRTWFGLKIGNEKRHGELFNITSISNA